MTNPTIITFTRNTLKELLSMCTDDQQYLFKRMYAHDNLDLPINEVVDLMPVSKLDWALSQVERTIKFNNNNNPT
jgi:hypothetical protein